MNKVDWGISGLFTVVRCVSTDKSFFLRKHLRAMYIINSIKLSF